jgi:hypothetical protein
MEDTDMNERKYSYAQLGMLLGIFVGGGLATILFSTTGEAMYFGLIGVGLALGLGLGAGLDRSRGQEPSSSEE